MTDNKSSVERCYPHLWWFYSRVYICVKAKRTLVSFFFTFFLQLPRLLRQKSTKSIKDPCQIYSKIKTVLFLKSMSILCHLYVNIMPKGLYEAIFWARVWSPLPLNNVKKLQFRFGELGMASLMQCLKESVPFSYFSYLIEMHRYETMI